MSRIVGSVLLCASLAPSLVASVVVKAKTSQCPLSHCNNEAGASLLELSSKRSSSKAKCNGGLMFRPAHFTCSSCDVKTCDTGVCKNVVCDVTKCIGKFYSQECWCTKPLNPTVEKIFCDDDCTGGLCDVKGLTCKTRESQCKPWWWCKLPPPKTADSFLQTNACAKSESCLHLNERFQQAKSHKSSASAVQQTTKKAKKQIDAFTFSAGSFVCDSALLPAPDEDPVTLAHSPPGFIVMDGNTCTGGYFQKNCFCWDKFKYLRGQDPMVTELVCDSGCGLGDCNGKTCGSEAPPPLPEPTGPPPLDPLVQEMQNEGKLRNYGTQMSPVT